VIRRQFITLLGGVAAAWPLAARAQESRRTYRLGSLQFSPRSAPWHVAFFDALRRQGFVEGQNLVGDPDGYSLRVDQLAAHAAELVKAKVDVTTGVSILTGDLNGKRQEILLEAVPETRIAALADANSISPQKLQELDDAARAHGVGLSVFRVTKEDEIPSALDAVKKSGAAALNVLASSLLFSARKIIIPQVAALRLPAIYQWPEITAEGGLIGYGPHITQIYGEMMSRQFAALLRGIKPADIPAEQPTKFDLAINLKTAKALGITLPPAFITRADEVIE
jgi:putative ABC transport system substrate-binding protein